MNLDPAFTTLKTELENLTQADTAKATSIAEVHAFVANSQRMLDIARNHAAQRDASYQMKRTAMITKARDNLARFDAEHHKAMDDLNSLIAKLEDLRD